jgi:hypothetical protein
MAEIFENFAFTTLAAPMAAGDGAMELAVVVKRDGKRIVTAMRFTRLDGGAEDAALGEAEA